MPKFEIHRQSSIGGAFFEQPHPKAEWDAEGNRWTIDAEASDLLALSAECNAPITLLAVTGDLHVVEIMDEEGPTYSGPYYGGQLVLYDLCSAYPETMRKEKP